MQVSSSPAAAETRAAWRMAAGGALLGTLGRDRSELLPGLRSLAHGSHVIFFRYHDDAVEIVTVLHGHRDIDAVFGEADELP